MKAIQWYPGHMTKARRMMTENLKLVDVVMEIVDARAPTASRNPDFDALFASKARIVVLNKSDLADPAATKAWVREFERQGALALEFTATVSSQKKRAVALIERASADAVRARREKGVNKTVRAMVAGIPNAGKSTFINCVSGAGSANTGNKPGVTKGKQWVKISPYLELLDTPGLLWPKLENQQEALHLAFIGSIRDEVVETDELAVALLELLAVKYPQKLNERYKKLDIDARGAALLEGVCLSRGFLLPGGALDTERAANTVLDEFRAGKIARVTLEYPAAAEKSDE